MTFFNVYSSQSYETTSCLVFKRNDYPSFRSFYVQAILFFFTSELIYFVLRPLKQTKFICDVLTGIMLGPSLLGRNEAIMKRIFPLNEMIVVNTLAILGGVYFIFEVTVKIDTARILRTAKYAWSISITCIAVTMAVAMGLIHLVSGYIPGSGPIKEYFVLYLTSYLAVAHFPVVAHSITELKLLNSELGQLAISCAILNEMFTWLSAALSLLSKGTTMQKIKSELSLCALLLFTIIFIRPMIKWIIRRTPEGKPVKEVYILGLLILPLVMGVLSDMVGVTVVPGAIMVGLMIPPGPPLGSALVERCEFVTSKFLLPFVYMRFGLLTNIYSIKDWKAFSAILLVYIGAYIGKICGSLLALVCFKTTVRNAILLSLILNLKGMNEYLLGIRWRVTTKMIDEATYTTMMLGNTILTAISTPIISTYYIPQNTLQASTYEYDEPRRITLLQATPLNSELRVFCGIHYEMNVHSIITLLRTLNPSEISPICAYIVHLQDLVGRATPLVATYNTRRKRLFSNSSDRIMRAVKNNLESSCLPVTLQPYTMIAPYNTMHQSIFRLAQDENIPLILLPFHRSQQAQETTMRLRYLNNNIEEHSPCTVGIFVDGGLPHQLKKRLSYHVAVFFLGGPDDREAMKLVFRMSDHSDMSITLFRIVLTPDYDKEENESEKRLDDSIINEFLSKNSDNEYVGCNEVVANDVMQVMDAIRCAEEDYDIVIVGKRRLNGSRLEQEMKPWVEYEELGVIGDMLASKDFCGGKMFVLVIQNRVLSPLALQIRESAPPFALQTSIEILTSKVYR